MVATFISYGGFILVVSAACLIAYRHADSLEVWVKKRFGTSR